MHMKPEINSRREFIMKSALAGSGLFLSRKILAMGRRHDILADVKIGAITYSFRSMPGSVEQTLKYCVDSGIRAIELMGDAVEVYAGAPEWQKPPKETKRFFKKIRSEHRTAMQAWRESVGMEKFADLKAMYNRAGVSIYAFKPDALNPKNSDGEIDYAMRVARTLGAGSVTVELPKDPKHSKRLGDIALANNMYVGYHAHTQATDTAWDEALAQSPYNSMNLDCGHYIAAGGKNTKDSLLALIEAKSDRITSMHLKDRTTPEHGAGNMPWGQGDTPIKEILQLMKRKGYTFPGTIELEYDIPEGSDAVKEVAKCLAYANSALA